MSSRPAAHPGPGVAAKAVARALAAAALFGAATPASKALLGGLGAFELAGALYLGAALAVAPLRGAHLLPAGGPDRRRLLGAVVGGGFVAPVLLLAGLRAAGAASVSLWLNFEVVATAVLGVVLFRDAVSPRALAGVALAFLGATLLSLGQESAGLSAAAMVLAACACWGLDNHLTARIEGLPAVAITFWKGLVAGATNLAIGVAVSGGASMSPSLLGAALLVGVGAYGASTVLYVRAARVLGATRAQVVFSTAPLFGVALSCMFLGETLTAVHLASGALLFAGVLAIAGDSHAHVHRHAAVEHEHPHRHDDGHHLHGHPGLAPGTRHSHPHRHDALEHEHPHWSDLHHGHRHGG